MRVMTATETTATATVQTGIETATVTHAGMAPATLGATVRAAMLPPREGRTDRHPPTAPHGLTRGRAPRR